MENKDRLFNVNVKCINSINISNVKYKYKITKISIKNNIINSITICALIINIILLINLAYYYLVG